MSDEKPVDLSLIHADVVGMMRIENAVVLRVVKVDRIWGDVTLEIRVGSEDSDILILTKLDVYKAHITVNLDNLDLRAGEA